MVSPPPEVVVEPPEDEPPPLDEVEEPPEEVELPLEVVPPLEDEPPEVPLEVESSVVNEVSPVEELCGFLFLVFVKLQLANTRTESKIGPIIFLFITSFLLSKGYFIVIN